MSERRITQNWRSQRKEFEEKLISKTRVVWEKEPKTTGFKRKRIHLFLWKCWENNSQL